MNKSPLRENKYCLVVLVERMQKKIKREKRERIKKEISIFGKQQQLNQKNNVVVATVILINNLDDKKEEKEKK